MSKMSQNYNFLSRPLVNYILLSAIRDKIVISILLIIALSLSISVYLGSAALTEKEKFVAVYSAGGIRVAAVIGLILFITFYIRRSFESRDIDFLLSRPISRLSFVFSHVAAFGLIAIGFCLVCSAALYPFVGGIEGNSFGLWSLSLLIEFLIMALAAMFFAMVISSAAASALITLGFYTLSRLIGQLVNIVASNKVGSVEADGGFAVMGNLMQAISLFIPRLDLMAQTSRLIYGAEGVVGFSFVLYHGVIFAGFIISATIIDLLKKEF